jgi:hypothetical protein
LVSDILAGDRKIANLFYSVLAAGGKGCICVAKTIKEGLDRETERLYQLDDHVQD